MKAKVFLLFLLSGLTALTINAQNLTVKGKVSDGSNGDPVPFATIVVKGMSTWTTTDAEGLYAIEAPANAILSVDCLGYITAEVSVSGKTSLDITLRPDLDQLSESVVIGYGVQQKKLLTGATIQVKGDDLAKLNTTTALGALQSQSPGVTITQNSGQPGEGFKVNVRGMGTIGDSEPLYVIDGVAGGSLSALNPADIESIDVLKDAASAAIYGARAANGVVLVTTKQGKEGRTVVSYDGYYGGQYIAKMPNLCNAQEYMDALDLMYKNEGIALTNWEAVLPAKLYQSIKNGTWKGTNWMEEAYNKGALTTNHAINVTGGSADHKYSLGFAYTAQDGIIGYNKIEPRNAQFQRYTFRINTDNVVIKNGDLNILRIGETLNFNHNTNSGIANDVDIYWNSVHNILRATPILPAYTYDENGNVTGFYDQEARSAEGWNFDTSTSSANPLAYDYYTSRGLQKSSSFTLQASAFAEFQPIKNLKFRSQFGYLMTAGSSRSYNMIYSINPKVFNDFDNVSQSMSTNQRITWENTVSYSLALDKHSFDVVAGQSIEKWGMGESVKGTGYNSIFPNDFERAYLSNTKPTQLSEVSVSGSPRSQGGLASFFGRVNYNYDSKYLVSATLRADGSSNFARGHRWGIFPSVSAGWVMSSEPWMENTQDWLSFLKLRASWGQNGNASIANFQYLSSIVLDTNASYAFDSEDSFAVGAVGDVLANPDVSWETSQQLDLGVDARFFNSRLGIAIDAYIKDTKDWLVRAPIASVYGLNAPYINGGDIRNQGIEFSIDWSKPTGDFTYGVNFNGAFNKNVVTRIANAEGIIHGAEDVLSEGTLEMYRAQVGYPIGYFYGFKTAGVFQNQAQIDNYKGAKYENAAPGDLIWVDTNNDGKIDNDDRTMIGDPNPHFTAGLNFWMAWKGFDFNLAGYGAFGQQVAKSYRSFADSQRDNFTTDVFQTWQGEGTSNKLPRLTYGSNPNWQNISDIYIENGDYFKISNVSIGYDFRKLVDMKYISKCRLFVQAQNLLTITKYSGMDPEMGKGTDDDWASGIDVGFYPAARTFLFGVNLQF